MVHVPLRSTVASKSSRLVLITGAGSGIGRASAIRFARGGDRVLVTDIHEQSATDTAAEITRLGGTATAYRQDTSDAEAWEVLLTDIEATHGLPDVLVNNAGIAIAGSFLEQTVADWDRLMAVNLDGVFYGSRAVAQALVKRGEGGHIVNIASAGAWVPNRVAAPYCASKAGVLMLSESMRLDLAPHHIGVSAICPGVIRTNLMSNGAKAGTALDQPDTFMTHAAQAQARFSYAGPEVVARAIDRAVRYNLGVVPVNPEAYFINGARRIAPGLTRAALGIGSMNLMESAANVLSRVPGRPTKSAEL
jgi:NAD(P)-dependent dehydrogenase (short-subunit alcohol dehydrogenase family)